MKRHPFFVVIVFLILSLYIAAPQPVSAYSDTTTHPALTQEIIKLFNHNNPGIALTNEEAELVIQGSIDEDTAPRWLRHFYDPVHNIGLTYGKQWQSSKEWSEDVYAQAGPSWTAFASPLAPIFSAPNDYTWERAVYEAAWGNRERALLSLGHVLHLLEDASVPDHTRNDPHPAFGRRLGQAFPGIDPSVIELLENSDSTDTSPYESFTARFNRGNISVADALIRENLTPPSFTSIGEYFDEIARYSNGNFFSRDTIFDSKYRDPIVKGKEMKKFTDGHRYEVGYSNQDGRRYHLVILGTRKLGSEIASPQIDDPDNLILTDYWTLLSRKAVLNGVGAVSLFFSEVEKEREGKILYERNKSFTTKAIEAVEKTLVSAVSSAATAASNAVKTAFEAVPLTSDFSADILGGSQDAETLQDAAESPTISSQTQTQNSETDSSSGGETRNTAEVPDDGIAAGSTGSPQEDSTISPQAGKSEPPQSTETVENVQSESADSIDPPQEDSNSSPNSSPTPLAPFFSGASFISSGRKKTEEEILKQKLNENNQDGQGDESDSITAPQTDSNPSDSENLSIGEEIGDTATSTASSTPSVSDNGDTSATTTAATTAPSDTFETATTSPQADTATSTPRSDTSSDEDTASTTPAMSLSVPPPSILSPLPLGGAVTLAGTTTIIASGTSTPFAAIGTDFSVSTATSSAEGEWILKLAGLAQGTTTLNFFATSPNGQTSSSTSLAVFVDSKPPDVALEVAECADSLSDTGCLVATTTLSLFWSSDSEDLHHFILDLGEGATSTEASPTRAASTTLSVQDNSSRIFSVSAVDKAGNVSATTSVRVLISLRPVIINEIAWMGTDAKHGSDEWIELYNTTDFAIPLAGWRLVSTTDGNPDITLQGAIEPKGYYLIERKNGGETDEETESPLTDIPADIWTSFGYGLNNKGEVLELRKGSETIDKTSRCHRWCAGSSVRYYTTMERRNPLAEGDLSENWSNNNIAIRNGEGAGGLRVLGTPKARNSVNYEIGWRMAGLPQDGKTSLNLSKEDSPYFISSGGLRIVEGATLVLGPGVVVKFEPDGRAYIEARGTLKAEGTEDEPVVFTSLYDDAYGGDTNKDGICAVSTGSPQEQNNASSTVLCPRPGDWKHIKFTETSEGSSLRRVIIRYGGMNYANQTERAQVIAEKADVVFDNAVIERGNLDGVKLLFSDSAITNSIIREHGDSTSIGLVIDGGAPSVSDSVFEKNGVGLRISGEAKAVVENNKFDQNKTAIDMFGPVSAFKNNTGGSNTLNAIALHNGWAVGGATTTLFKNSLSYIIDRDFSVREGATLTFEKGVVLKGSVSSSGGRLSVKDGGAIVFRGENPEDLILTSEFDDSRGERTHPTAASTSPAYGNWKGIVVEEGGTMTMSGFTLRYAAKNSFQTIDGSAVRFTGGRGVIRDSLIENNLQAAFILSDGARVELYDSAIKSSTNSNIGTRSAIVLRDGGATTTSLTLSKVSFSGNETDITAYGATEVMCESSCAEIKTFPEGLLE